MATGMPKISGQGVATTSTARPRTGSPVSSQAVTAIPTESGVNRNAARSAKRVRARGPVAELVAEQRR